MGSMGFGTVEFKRKERGCGATTTIKQKKKKQLLVEIDNKKQVERQMIEKKVPF